MSTNAKRLSKAAYGFADIVMVQSMDLKLQYVDRLVGCVKNHERSYLALKIIRQIMRNTFENSVKKENEKKHPEIDTLSDMVAHLEKKHQLFDAVFADLAHYCDEVGKELKNPARKEDLADHLDDAHKEVIVDNFIHADQIGERLDFILYYAKAGLQVKIRADHLATVWDMLVVRAAIPHDRKIVYGWLREMCDKFMSQQSLPESEQSAARIVTIEDLLAFFRKSIIGAGSTENSDFLSDLSIDGFHCVQSFFILINQTSGKLQRVTEGDASYKGKHLPDSGKEGAQEGKAKNSKSFDVGMDVVEDCSTAQAGQGGCDTGETGGVGGDYCPPNQFEGHDVATGPEKPKAAFTAFGSDTGAVYQPHLNFDKKDENQIDTSGKGPSTPTNKKSTSVGTGVVYGPQLPGQSGAAVPLADKDKYTGGTATEKKIDPEDIHLEIKVKPTTLEGHDVLWRIATEASGKQVIDAAAKLLVQIHHDVSADNEPKLAEFDDIYINTCMSIIAREKPLILNRSKEDHAEAAARLAALPTTATQIMVLKALPLPERRIVRIAFLLKQMVRASEKLGTHGVKPHQSLQKGNMLPNVQVQNNVTHASDLGHRSRFDVAVASSETLWELKRIIGREIVKTSLDGGKTWGLHPIPGTDKLPPPIHPATIRVYQMASTKDVKDARNGDTLKEISFGKSEQISIYRKSSFLTRAAPILYDDDEGKAVFTARAAAVLTEIFEEYSDYREDLPEPKRVMTVDHCIRYTFDCTGNPSGKADHRMQTLMNRYSYCGTKWDEEKDEPVAVPGEEQLVDLEGYLRFAREAICFGKEDRLRNNLRKLGYSNDLSRAPKDGEDENILQLRKRLEDMPRHKVAQKEHWETLMALLEVPGDLGGQLQARTLELIRMLATQPQLYQTVRDLSDDWKSIFDASMSANHVQYTLEIIESIINGQADWSDQELARWLKKFVDLGGLEELQLQLKAALESADAGPGKKRLVDQLLKLLRIFIITSVAGEEKDETKDDRKTGDKITEASSKAETTAADANSVAEAAKAEKKVTFATDDATTVDTENITTEALFGRTDSAGGDDDVKVTAVVERPHADELPDPGEMLRIRRAMSSGVADGMLSRIDMAGLQALMLRTVDFMLTGSTTEDLPKEDRLIIESAMNLWAHLAKVGKKTVDVDKDFLLRGLIAKEIAVRESFEASLKELASLGPGQREKLFDTLVGLLEELEEKHKDGKVKLARAQPFFGVLLTLVKDRLEERADQADDPGIYLLAQKCVRLAIVHESGETRSSFLKDSLLVGYLETLATVIESIKTDLPEKREAEEKWSDYATNLFKLVTGPISEGSERNVIDFVLGECLFQHDMIDGQIKLSKCCSTDARKAGFAVVENYAKLLRPHEMAQFLEAHLLPLLNSCPRPERWRYKPSSGGRVHSHCGIQNLGCICYMISMLQQFYMVPQFRYQLLRAVDETPENLVEYKGEKIDDNLLKQLQKMFGFLELSDKQAYHPAEFVFSFKDFLGEPTKIGEQKDSQEFINLFCDRVEDLLKPTSQRHLLRDVFAGHCCSQLICPACGKTRSQLEMFYNLSIQIKGLQDIHQSLQSMLDGQIIEDFRCGACDKKVNILKRSLLADMPNTLIVHLNRIMFSYDTLENDKINSHFAFPKVLDLKPYSYKAAMQDQDKKYIDEDLKGLLDISDDDYVYRLVGINIHTGTADAGHYYSLIDIKRGIQEPDPLHSDENLKEWQNVEADSWKEFNDSSVSAFDVRKKLEEEAFGTKEADDTAVASDAMTDEQLAAFLQSGGGGTKSYGKSAYMLVYERKSKRSLRVIEQKDGKDEEVSVNFREVEKFVPEWISSQVMADNKTFIVDHNMFADPTFNFVKGILKYINSELIMTGYTYPHEYSSAHFDKMKALSLEVSGKVLYDMLVHYDHNIMINEVSAAIQTILTFSDRQFRVVAGTRSAVAAFVRKWVLDEREHFLKTLYSCTDLVARKYASNICGHALNRLFSLYYRTDPAKRADSEAIIEVKKTIDEFFDMYFAALQDKECHKSWSRLDGFFRLIEMQSKNTLTQSQYLLERDGDVIADLIDFILGNASPRMANVHEKRYSMGGSITAPPFQPLYTAISHLIRHTHTIHMDLGERLPTHATVPVDEKTGEPKFEGDFEQYKTYGLGEEAWNMIKYTDFIEKPLFDIKYSENKEYAAALAHLSYGDFEFSSRIITKLLKAVAYADNDQIKRHLHVVDALARVADDFQAQRLEMLFGCPFVMNVRDPSNTELLQYGAMAGALNSAESVYMYGTTLDSQSVDDCLLAALLKGSKSVVEGYTRTALETLCTLITEDENIGAHFAKLPAVDYNTRRYTDWIKPYLEGKLTENAKLLNSAPGAEKKAEDILRVMALIDKYDESLKGKELPASLKYAIVEAVSQKEVRKDILCDGKLVVEVHQIACEWVEAPPPGVPAIDAARLCALKAAKFQSQGDEEKKDDDKDKKDDAKGEEAKAPEYEPFDVCDDALFRFSVSNPLTTNVMFDFRFRETGDSNLEFPRGQLRDYMTAAQTHPVITLRKTDITKPANLSALAFEVVFHEELKNGKVEIGQYASTTNKPITASPGTDTDGKKAPSGVAAGRRNGVLIDLTNCYSSDAGTAVEADGAPRTNVGEFNQGDTKAADAGTSPANYVEVCGSSSADAGSSKKKCPFCGYENEAAHAFCLACYADLS